MIRNERKGFTLIEILIVVAIIAILASVVLVGLGPTQQAGRDARRISDLREVQNGLELYFNRCGFYPGQAAPASGACTFSKPADWAALTTVLDTSGIGVTNVPNDPNTNQSYIYGSIDGSGYAIGAKLENTANSALTTDVDGPNVQGINCDDPEYCVQL